MICSAGCNAWQKNDILEEPLSLFFLTTRCAEQITPLDTCTVSISGNFATFFFAEQMSTKMLSKSFAQQCKGTDGLVKIGLILKTICSACFDGKLICSANCLVYLLSLFAQRTCSAGLFSIFAQYICSACLLSIVAQHVCSVYLFTSIPLLFFSSFF